VHTLYDYIERKKNIRKNCSKLLISYQKPRNETKRNQRNRNETKRNQRNENQMKRNQRKQNEIN
jgi:hypothetical protein